jgi:hypothetical protein
LDAVSANETENNSENQPWMQNVDNITELFYQYRSNALSKVDGDKMLPIESSLHELFALNHTFLLCSDQYSEAQIQVFGKELLDQLYNSLVESHLQKSYKFSDEEILKVIIPISKLALSAASAEDVQFELLDASKSMEYSKQRVFRAIALR